MKTWKNGEKAGVIKQIIDSNFNTLESRLARAGYSKLFTSSDWIENEISIPYAQHLIQDPVVTVFVKEGDSYSTALGGVSIDQFHNVVLNSSISFNGKVVIK